MINDSKIIQKHFFIIKKIFFSSEGQKYDTCKRQIIEKDSFHFHKLRR